jgi:Rps23 Pro-64 3,4-dihydroxylase Tpa1-like proline 4-hydroxylase
MAIVTSTATGQQDVFVFDKDQPLEHARALAPRYSAATPFPHIVLDDFLDPAFAESIVKHFPAKDAASVLRLNANAYLKRGYRPDDLGANPCRQYLYQFSTGPFLQFLEALTGIQGLIPDPYFAGGGLHETECGGRLEVHADFNLYAPLNLVRRINVIVYLNKDWRPEYGGQLELWDTEMSRCVTSVEPEFNRCVVFNTDKTTFHGHPQPVACPERMSRRSIAIYYYTAPAGPIEPTAKINELSIFKVRPGTSGAQA